MHSKYVKACISFTNHFSKLVSQIFGNLYEHCYKGFKGTLSVVSGPGNSLAILALNGRFCLVCIVFTLSLAFHISIVINYLIFLNFFYLHSFKYTTYSFPELG